MWKFRETDGNIKVKAAMGPSMVGGITSQQAVAGPLDLAPGGEHDGVTGELESLERGQDCAGMHSVRVWGSVDRFCVDLKVETEMGPKE